ncbi:MAG: oxygen-independent coproporphyrinogen III oxidase-like protein [Burkholderiales bacterium]|nr:oxygen-independent coproporphyrinogen III oxidase-like protein [Burkholderiales bacterium]
MRREPVDLPAAPHALSTMPLALYIHIPWCVKKCPYCDFNSHEAHGEIPQQSYVDVLLADLRSALPEVLGREIVSVFFGGGTPSLFSPVAIEQILLAADALLPFVDDIEITLEANPGTVDAVNFAGFRAAGVTRLSLGIQSLNDGHLRALGRIHDAGQAKRAIDIARRHFENFNLDLMYGLPGQMADQALDDLAAALDYEPPHLSAYHLTLEPNTLFHKYPPALPTDDDTSAMQAAIEETLAARGYCHYETSAFALPGREARHNLNYWQFGDYLGIGAGAHSKISSHDAIVRQMRYKQPRAYIEHASTGAPVQQKNEIAAHDLAFEFMMNALRLNQGFAPDLFEQRTGLTLTAIQAELDEAVQRGLLVVAPERIAPTLPGQRFLNDLLQIFLP